MAMQMIAKHFARVFPLDCEFGLDILQLAKFDPYNWTCGGLSALEVVCFFQIVKIDVSLFYPALAHDGSNLKTIFRGLLYLEKTSLFRCGSIFINTYPCYQYDISFVSQSVGDTILTQFSSTQLLLCVKFHIPCGITRCVQNYTLHCV